MTSKERAEIIFDKYREYTDNSILLYNPKKLISTMIPKEKAKELFDKYFSEIRMPSDCEGCMQCVDRCDNMVAIAKKYTLIAVGEILNIGCIEVPYWLQVKTEIEAL